MENNGDELLENHNLKCHVCGESQFEEREGFYYCQECGTKQEQVRLVEIGLDDEGDQTKKAKKQKVHADNTDKPRLSSWECYNYILRGFVEELLSIGAKEELKLMTIQVWAAYLRRIEVAFFNRKQPDLPKLGVKYLENDAQTIYNHTKNVQRKRRRKRVTTTKDGCTNDSDSRSKTSRDWNINKQKLDESNYSLTSGASGLTSSTSANSNRAIRITFSKKARSYLKKKMPVRHIKKHEADSESILKCHKQPTAREINRTDYNLILVNIKHIYSILAIALNLIGDDIQLCDLIRFINEEHIGTFNVLQYFPENIANTGKELLRKIKFNKCPDKYSDKALRDHIGIMCKHIGIRALKVPNLSKLVHRYIEELCLPRKIGDYIERLINFLPPKFNTRVMGHYPAYEARAMAYIIFTLKLLFGLDGSKEYRMSRSSKSINSRIKRQNRRRNENQPLLFVWSEWVEYIEMRKLIVSQFNTSFCEQFNQCQSTKQVLEQMDKEMRRTEEKDNLFNDTSENLRCTDKLKTLKTVFQRFQETYKSTEEDNKHPLMIEFKPSFTPALSYFRNILLHCDEQTNMNSSFDIKIPDFMRIDHSQRDIHSYLEVKPLIEYFKNDHINLKLHVLETNENKQLVGMFHVPRNSQTATTLFKASFAVTEDEWSAAICSRNYEKTDDLEFNADLKFNDKTILKENKKRKKMFDQSCNYNAEGGKEEMLQQTKFSENIRYENKSVLSNGVQNNLQFMHSFELFSENNMEPVDNKQFITKPRRNLGNNNLFEGISDEESVLENDDTDDGNIPNDSEVVMLDENRSSQASPILEEFIKIEPDSTNDSRGKTLIEDTPSESNNRLKMYISNMDCWMIFGALSIASKAQRSELQDKFPRSFNWLLETCAQTINVEWSAVFEQLIGIELMFCFDLTIIENCIYLNSSNPCKEIQKLINSYRKIW